MGGRYYRPFDLRKIAGEGKWRHIDNPVGELKRYQSCIQERMFHDLVFPETMIGAVPGRSIRDNAQLHLSQPMVVTLDLRDCFPRISDAEVYRVFREVLGCSAEVSSILTKLTTFQHRLPQGAPTSPAIANLSLLGLHDELSVLAGSYGLNCSFYIDDIVFSGARSLEVIEPAIFLIHSHGHSVRRSKIKRMPKSTKQIVRGVVVNRGVSVGKGRRRALRSRVFDLSRDGAVAEHALQSILGEVTWISRLNSAQGKALTRSAEELQRLPAFPGIRIPKGQIRPCKSYGSHKQHKSVRSLNSWEHKNNCVNGITELKPKHRCESPHCPYTISRNPVLSPAFSMLLSPDGLGESNVSGLHTNSVCICYDAKRNLLVIA